MKVALVDPYLHNTQKYSRAHSRVHDGAYSFSRSFSWTLFVSRKRDSWTQVSTSVSKTRARRWIEAMITELYDGEEDLFDGL